MFADVMNCPVETVSADETGALGCCVAVAAALGDYAGPAEAASAMCHLSEPVLPNGAAAKAYDEKYQLYLKTITCLDGLWPDLQAYIERRN